MAISSATIKPDGTSAVTGGTAITLADSGGTLDRRSIICTDDSLESQRNFEFSVVRSKPSTTAPNGYTQGRREAYLRFPLSLDNGNMTTNSIRITLSCDPETTASEVAGYLETAAQVLYGSSLANFWKLQATA